MQSIDLIETYSYGRTRKDLVSEKEEVSENVTI